ncbi:MAG: HEAT repeat domain-containing protein [Spirosomaceae bacterium]|jgi:hypothetical protein|nr:HEAT repeat domain-containing protein [Spirosomataceae bacterium]
MTYESLKKLLKLAISTQNPDLLQKSIELYWEFEEKILLENEFNQLIITPNHDQYQYLLKYLQDQLKYPSSVKFLDEVLSKGFEYMNHYSEDGAKAKWFSHALASIGTPEAIDVLKKHAASDNDEIKVEMLYRLSRINSF